MVNGNLLIAKTGIPPSRLEAIVNDIESRLQQDSKREVTSQEIGQLVLEYLRQESEVAYVRFASVYGNFQGIRDFIAALALLQSSEIERAHPSWSQVEEASVITSS